MAAAYKAHFGKPLDTTMGSATAAWVKALAANSPLVADSTAVAAAVGAPDQMQPFVGLVPVAKYRDNIDKKFVLAICTDVRRSPAGSIRASPWSPPEPKARTPPSCSSTTC